MEFLKGLFTGNLFYTVNTNGALEPGRRYVLNFTKREGALGNINVSGLLTEGKTYEIGGARVLVEKVTDGPEPGKGSVTFTAQGTASDKNAAFPIGVFVVAAAALAVAFKIDSIQVAAEKTTVNLIYLALAVLAILIFWRFYIRKR